ncbi:MULTISPECIES: hypothetical protein [unclassified Microbacterium]|uniref:hypothetical protein n=1 Tax=unclassified Microbacterium TaxID=2609290 RepID=UPI00301A0743
MASGFKINKEGIRQFTRELEREFAKNPVRIPVEADSSTVGAAGALTVNNYHGPVVTVTGGNAQLAWNNAGDVSQTQKKVEQIAPGYEDLARALTDLLAELTSFGLGDDEQEARSQAEAVLAEVVKTDPDQGVIRRGLTMIKGLLAPIAAGVTAAVTAESTEAARHTIEVLGSSLPL